MIIENTAAKIKFDFNIGFFTKQALDVYSNLNHKEFPEQFTVPAFWFDCIDFIVKQHNQNVLLMKSNVHIPKIEKNDEKIVLSFSGGLDSMYQALYLRECGYDVTLLHICNLNKYTNGQEKKAVVSFAKDFDFKLNLVEFSAKNNDKYWQENSFKTCLCYAICMDYCIENNINMISSGDDLRLNAVNCVVGTNLGDCKEITTSFFKNLPFVFIPVKCQNKVDRLRLLEKYNAKDYYYSCVNAGRLNQYLHNKFENKYNIKIDKYSCGTSCRKCAFHLLLEQYYMNKKYDDEIINKCWNTISKGADNIFFDKSIPLEKRIHNLIIY